MIYAGIDIAKSSHVIGAVDERGKDAAKPMQFANSAPTIYLSCFDCFYRTIQNAMQLLARQVCRHMSWGAYRDPAKESDSLPHSGRFAD